MLTRYSLLGATLLALVVGFATSASAQSSRTSNRFTLTQASTTNCAVLDVSGMGRATFDVVGTWAGTVAFYVDGAAGSRNALDVATADAPGTFANDTNTNGLFQGDVAGYSRAVACFTVATSGAPQIVIQASQGGGGGGGGGGAASAITDIEDGAGDSIGDDANDSIQVSCVFGCTAATSFDLDTGAGTENVAGASLRIEASGGSIPVTAGVGNVAAGTPRITLAANDPAVALLTTIDGDTGSILTAVQLIDNAISGAGFNITQEGGVAISLNAGTADTGTRRTVTASDSPEIAHLAALAAALQPEDDPHTTADPSFPLTCVQRAATTPTATANAAGDYAVPNCDANGRLLTSSTFYTSGGVELTADPCSAGTISYIPIDITTAATTEVTASLAGASTHYYICALNLMTTAANFVSLVDDDSDNCGSVTSAIIGGLTATEGWSLPATGGLAIGSGASAVMRTNGTNRVLCLVTSANTQLAGHIKVSAAP